MHVHQTPTRLVVRHRPRLAAVVAGVLWCLSLAAPPTILILSSGELLILALGCGLLLGLTGLAVFLSEPRARMWIFDRAVQEMLVLRVGWLGALRTERTLALNEIASPKGSPLGSHTEHLFDGGLRWASDRRRVLRRVCGFLEASRVGGSIGAD